MGEHKRMINRAICSLLSGACFVAAAMAPCTLPAPSGDANGDNRVDVLDLQAIIIQVLAGELQDSRADVNRDGRVDILDFQSALDRASMDEPAPAPPAGDREDAVFHARAHGPNPPAPSQAVSFFPPGKRVTTAALRARSVPSRLQSARVARYTYGLTPNAPPAFPKCA